MPDQVDVETFDLERYAESLAKAAQEGVRWEIRKLEWMREDAHELTKPAETVAR